MGSMKIYRDEMVIAGNLFEDMSHCLNPLVVAPILVPENVRPIAHF